MGVETRSGKKADFIMLAEDEIETICVIHPHGENQGNQIRNLASLNWPVPQEWLRLKPKQQENIRKTWRNRQKSRKVVREIQNETGWSLEVCENVVDWFLASRDNTFMQLAFFYLAKYLTTGTTDTTMDLKIFKYTMCNQIEKLNKFKDKDENNKFIASILLEFDRLHKMYKRGKRKKF